MKIGIFLPNATFDLPGMSEVGGIEVFAMTVGEAWQRAGHEVVLYGGLPKKGRQHRDTSLALRLFDYVETSSIPDIGTRFQRLVQRLHFGWKSWGAIQSDRPEIIILSKPFDWPVAAFWKRQKLESKVVMGFHGEDYFAGDRLFYGAVDAAFAVSRRVGELAQKRLGILPSVIPNPVDCHFFSPSSGADHRAGVPLLAATGRLVGWKGFHVLIHAVAQLHAEGFPVRCTLAGDGPEYPRLLKEIEQHGLNEFFHLAGRLGRNEVKALLQEADAYVLPSIGFESFSIAALEGACMGLPLILSDQVALAEALSPRDFEVATRGDASAFSRAIREVLRRPLSVKERLARHLRVSAEFSPESVASRLIQLATRDSL